eukprot:gene11180-11261_t
MGVGKTTFSKAFIRSLLKDNKTEVPSPTFTLVQTYQTDKEDFGDHTFTAILKQSPAREKELYQTSITVLRHLHQHAIERPNFIPLYSIEKLLIETEVFIDWYWKAVTGEEPKSDIKEEFQNSWKKAFENCPATPQSLVLRDFHVDNLMIVDEQDGIKGCGLLDFQDALWGSVVYDLNFPYLNIKAIKQQQLFWAQLVIPKLLESLPAMLCVKALPHFDQNKPILIVNGDIWWKDGPIPMLSRLCEAWDRKSMDILLLIVPKDIAIGYFAKGDYFLKPDQRLEHRGDHDSAPYVYPGVMIINPLMIKNNLPKNFSVKLLFDQAESKKRLFGHIHDNLWGDIGSLIGLENVRKEISM